MLWVSQPGSQVGWDWPLGAQAHHSGDTRHPWWACAQSGLSHPAVLDPRPLSSALTHLGYMEAGTGLGDIACLVFEVVTKLIP